MIRYCNAPLLLVLLVNVAVAGEWTVPLAGNAFRTAPDLNDRADRRDGTLSWRDTAAVYSAYFHIDRPAKLQLKLSASSDATAANLVTLVEGKRIETKVEASVAEYSLGQVEIDHAGYVRVDFQLAKTTDKTTISLRELKVVSDATELTVDFVRNNDGGMFYWGRRGPSVHLRYVVPEQRTLEYAYSEITVPEGEDTLGTYFMANGFGEGYFGFQVNGPNERRVLFSVWSPFKTDAPARFRPTNVWSCLPAVRTCVLVNLETKDLVGRAT